MMIALVKCLVTTSTMMVYLVLVLMIEVTRQVELLQVTLLGVIFASNAVYLVLVTLEIELVVEITMLIGHLI